MINVAILSVIRRWHRREGLTIREITRRTGLSRNTVKKYLSSGVIEPRYPKRKSASRLDSLATTLAGWLGAQSSQNRKQRKSLRQMHADLKTLGYTGSYDRVAAFARAWRRHAQERLRTAGRGTFVPLVFAPGEAFQFDWSEEAATIEGLRVKLQVAQFKLCFSRAFVLRAYPLQTHEMLFDAHNHAFAMFGGVPRRGIYDNMKTAVDRVRAGKLRDVNARFAALVSHYLFEAQFCNPAAGLRERTDREERAGCQTPAVAHGARLREPGRPQCLARGALSGALERNRPSRAARPHRGASLARCARRADAAPATLRWLRRAHLVGCRRPASCTSSATATAFLRRSPTGR